MPQGAAPGISSSAGSAAELPPHVELAHLDPRGAVHDAVHDRVGVHAPPSRACQSFCLNWVQRTVEHEP